jgi:hypothetical protein
VKRGREQSADDEQDVDGQCRLDLRHVRKEPEPDRRKSRGRGLNEGLPQEKREAGSKEHERNADRDVVDLGGMMMM